MRRSLRRIGQGLQSILGVSFAKHCGVISNQAHMYSNLAASRARSTLFGVRDDLASSVSQVECRRQHQHDLQLRHPLESRGGPPSRSRCKRFARSRHSWSPLLQHCRDSLVPALAALGTAASPSYHMMHGLAKGLVVVVVMALPAAAFMASPASVVGTGRCRGCTSRLTMSTAAGSKPGKAVRHLDCHIS